MKIKDIAQKIENEMAVAIDQANRDAEYDSAFIEDRHLYFTNNKGATEWNCCVAFNADCEFKNGLLSFADVNGDLTSIMVYVMSPMKI